MQRLAAVVPAGSRAVGVLLGTLLLTSPLPAQACGSDRLALAETGALPLPATFGIQGSASDGRGAVALWSVAGELLSIDAGHALARTRIPDVLTPAGLALSGDTLRFLDLAGGREYRVVAGKVEPTGEGIALSPELLLEQAVWLGTQWVVLVREVATGAALVYGASSGAPYRVAPSGDPATLRRVQLSPAGTAVLVSDLMAPFRLVRLDPGSGRADTLGAVLGPAAAAIPPDSLSHWRALPAVALDCAVLLTLADLGSDRRVLARYDATGRLARVTALEAPLGMVAALGEASLLAARRAGELELVWYTWRWVRDPAVSSQ